MLLGLFGFALGLSADFAVLLSALFLAHPVHTESVPQQQLNVGDLKCCLCGKAVLETLLAYQKQLHLSTSTYRQLREAVLFKKHWPGALHCWSR